MSYFQKSTNRYPAKAVQGDLVTSGNPNGNPVVYWPFGAKADTGLVAGGFAWVTADTDGLYVANGTGTGVPTGLVSRQLQYPIVNAALSESMAVTGGFSPAIIQKGEVWVMTTDPGTVGKVLFANNTTGAITCAAAGATVAGATETTWTIIALASGATAESGGQLVAVSKW